MGNSQYLFEEIEKENIKGIDKILQKDKSLVNKFFNKEKTSSPLLRAVWRNSEKVINYLIEQGADVNLGIEETNASLPIIIACFKGYLNVIKILVKNNANINICDLKGFTPLDHCIIRGKYHCAKYLYKLGLKPKNIDFYELEKERFISFYINFDVFINIIKENKEYTDSEINELIFKKIEKLKDPVIDPRESWKKYITRTLKFEEPPLIERSKLPDELKPENKSKLKSMISWNQSMYAKSKTVPSKNLNRSFNNQIDQKDINIKV